MSGLSQFSPGSPLGCCHARILELGGIQFPEARPHAELEPPPLPHFESGLCLPTSNDNSVPFQAAHFLLD